jgi:hypothetical protein
MSPRRISALPRMVTTTDSTRNTRRVFQLTVLALFVVCSEMISMTMLLPGVEGRLLMHRLLSGSSEPEGADRDDRNQDPDREQDDRNQNSNQYAINHHDAGHDDETGRPPPQQNEGLLDCQICLKAFADPESTSTVPPVMPLKEAYE